MLGCFSFVLQNVLYTLGREYKNLEGVGICFPLDLFPEIVVALKRAVLVRIRQCAYFDVVYLVTALVPSLTACLASSPGRRRRTAVWTSRLEMVDFLL